MSNHYYPNRYSGGGVDHRQLAKAGMTAALAACMATGFMKGKKARQWHTASAVALVGFAVYHHVQYS